MRSPEEISFTTKEITNTEDTKSTLFTETTPLLHAGPPSEHHIPVGPLPPYDLLITNTYLNDSFNIKAFNINTILYAVIYLYPHGLALLTHLDSETLTTVCLNAAVNFPNICINVLTSSLGDKISDRKKSEIIRTNMQIALQLADDERTLHNLGAKSLYAICSSTAKLNPEISVKILKTAALRNEIFFLDQIDLFKRNNSIAVKLYEEGDEFLLQLAPKVLSEICKITANTAPHISIHILINPRLRAQIAHYEREIMEENPELQEMLDHTIHVRQYLDSSLVAANFNTCREITPYHYLPLRHPIFSKPISSFYLTPAERNWLLHSSSDALLGLCVKTADSNPNLTIYVLSTPLLRDKIPPENQYEIVSNNYAIAKGLYNKGDKSLLQLNASCLHGICIATANKYPDASVYILTTPKLREKMDSYFCWQLLLDNPHINQQYQHCIQLYLKESAANAGESQQSAVFN